MVRKPPKLNLMTSQKVGNHHIPSFRRKPESRKNKDFWTPVVDPAFIGASAGVTALMTFYETIKIRSEIAFAAFDT